MGERDPTTPAEVERELVRRIAALDGSAYRYDLGPPAVWRESNVALTVTGAASELSHLRFNVWTDAGKNSGNDRGGMEDGYLWVACDVFVAFVFRLRPPAQTEDMRTASDAAIDVLRAVMGPWAADGPCVQVDVPAGGTWYRPSMTRDGEWGVVLMQFLASFDLRIDPSPETVPPTTTP